MVPTVGAIRGDLINLRMHNMSLLLASSDAELEANRKGMQQARDTLQEHVRQFESLLISERGKAQYATLLDRLTVYLDNQARYIKAFDSQNTVELRRLTGPQGTMVISANALAGEIDTLSGLCDIKVTRLAQASLDTYNQAWWITIAMMIAALVGTLLLAWRFTRSLTGPLDKAVAVAERIADNDLSQPPR